MAHGRWLLARVEMNRRRNAGTVRVDHWTGGPRFDAWRVPHGPSNRHCPRSIPRPDKAKKASLAASLFQYCALTELGYSAVSSVSASTSSSKSSRSKSSVSTLIASFASAAARNRASCAVMCLPITSFQTSGL